MADNVITYEQPLNELIRVCLRLEYLFDQIDHLIDDTSILGSRNVTSGIINLLHLLDRPDLKAKLAKELNHHLTVLGRLQNTPEIDQKKLRQLLNQLESLLKCFIESNGKIGQKLRDLELFNNLRLHLTNPGGGCCFDIPIFHHWLQQPAKQRQSMIKSWLDEFNNIRLASKLILQLVREGTRAQSKTAEKGFYQEFLDPQVNLRLIRIAIPTNINAYPEVSVSRHFVGVRFYSPNIHDRPSQYPTDLPFSLAYCIT